MQKENIIVPNSQCYSVSENNSISKSMATNLYSAYLLVHIVTI